MSQSAATPAPGGARGARRAWRTSRKQGLLALVLALLALALVVAADHAWHAYHAYRRFDAGRTAPGVRDPADYPLQTWLPVRIIARNHRVPASVLLDALREAGFTVQAQDTVPDLPGPLRGAIPQAAAGGRLLEPDRQSLRQIAWYSHRDSSEAVRVATEAIRTYRQTHPQPPPGPPGRPGSPGAPAPREGAAAPAPEDGRGARP
jgi:hypothetical protein